MLDAIEEHWERDGDCDRLHMERFQPIIGKGDAEQGEGGTIRFPSQRRRGGAATARSRSSSPARRRAATLPVRLPQGICHTCVGKLCSGKVRDLRTGEVSGSQGEMIRTCINAPEGAVEIAL